MSDRLRLAVENGHVALPEGQILVLNAPSPSGLSVLDPAKTHIWARTASAQAAFELAGWQTGASRSAIDGAIVILSRAKDEQRACLRYARGVTAGPIIIDGDKTNGVDAMYRELRKRAEVSEAWSKAHGKVFTVNGGNFDDWPDLAPQLGDDGWWRAPGSFSAEGPDKASVFLTQHLPPLSGSVVDLGAGWGFLSAAILESPNVTTIYLVEDHNLSAAAAQRNITDPRAMICAADALTWRPPEKVDHVVTNPPFHAGRKANPKLGQAFIQAAARMLKPQGQLWLVANRHLPYEATLKDAFKSIELHAETPSFKIFHATSPKRRKA